MKTGHDAGETGTYSSECCVIRIYVVEGQMFPRCPLCYELTEWEFIKRSGPQKFTRTPISTVRGA